MSKYKECPMCSTAIPEWIVQLEHAYCQCGWEEAEELDNLASNTLQNKKLKYVIAGFSLTVLVLLLCLKVLWGMFMFEGPYLRAKFALNLSDKNEVHRLGVICNLLEKNSCSIDIWSQIVTQDSKNTKAIANLAFVLAKEKEYEKAIKYFETYLENGGSSYDSIYWYAHSLANFRRKDEAIGRYYQAISLNPYMLNVALEFSDMLMLSGKEADALTILTNYCSTTTTECDAIESRIIQLDTIVGGEIFQSKIKNLNLRTFKTNGNFYLPIKLNSYYSIPFILEQNPSENETFIDLNLLNGLNLAPDKVQNITLETVNGPIEGKKAVVEKFSIGGMLFTNVDVFACNLCKNTLGKKLLEQLYTQDFKELGIEFLKVQRKN